MRNILLLLAAIFIITSSNCYSQKENNNWYFGFGAGITFNTPDGEPVALASGKIYTDEGTASASDKDGNLLFYTDGDTVWTKYHTIMANGTNLAGSTTSSHSALIIPKPGDNSIYYIFTTENRENLEIPKKILGLRYSVVDLSLNSGLGEITQKKHPFV